MIKYSENVDTAIMIAEKVHRDQSYGLFPYMYHIHAVFNLAIRYGFGYNEDILIACILHDAMEDGNLSYNDIKKIYTKKIHQFKYFGMH